MVKFISNPGWGYHFQVKNRWSIFVNIFFAKKVKNRSSFKSKSMSFLQPIVPWANGSNIYEVNIRQYTPEGTINAFSEHIPRLYDMGIKIIWLMPITPISIKKRQGKMGSYYAASSYIDIDPFYGTAGDFRNLVLKAHSLGMKVMIDWVANHTGYDHVWTTKYPQYYHKDKTGNFIALHQWTDVIDLDYTNPEMRSAMICSMKHWIKEFDLDGFRCDMARTVPLDFWLQARSECDLIKPLLWLAECEIRAYYNAFDINYGWEVMRALDKYFSKGKPLLHEIKDMLKDYAKYPPGTRKLLFTSNHDENTYYGTEYEKYGMAAKAVAVLTCTWPGIPLIYSGQELPNKKRLSFFEKDEIKWTGNFELHEFYKTLLNLRTHNKALQEDAFAEILQTNDPDILVYLCKYDNDRVLVLLNFGREETRFHCNHSEIGGHYEDLFEKKEVILQNDMHLLLEPGEFKVYYRNSF